MVYIRTYVCYTTTQWPIGSPHQCCPEQTMLRGVFAVTPSPLDMYTLMCFIFLVPACRYSQERRDTVPTHTIRRYIHTYIYIYIIIHIHIQQQCSRLASQGCTIKFPSTAICKPAGTEWSDRAKGRSNQYGWAVLYYVVCASCPRMVLTSGQLAACKNLHVLRHSVCTVHCMLPRGPVHCNLLGMW